MLIFTGGTRWYNFVRPLGRSLGAQPPSLIRSHTDGLTSYYIGYITNIFLGGPFQIAATWGICSAPWSPFQDQFNSITCNSEDYTCSDPNLTFNDGCNLLEWQTADPTCSASGSHNNHGCHPMNPMCGMNKPTDGSVPLSNYALYKVKSKRWNMNHIIWLI